MKPQPAPEECSPPNVVSFGETIGYHPLFGPAVIKPMILTENPYAILNTNYVKVYIGSED